MNCKIVGYEYKTLEVTLVPGESFYAERGSIVYVDEALQRDVEFNGSGSGNGGLGSLLGGVLKSALSGESILIIRFYNSTNTERKMVLSGSCCALVPIRLQGENLICRRGHYVASTNKINLNLNISLQGLLGGVGLFQKIDGNATVFLDSLGSPIEKILGNGETIEIDENHIVAFKGFSPSQIQAGWSVGNVLRGEGLSLMKVTGPGKVYLSPLPMIVYKNN
ncbi:AIM24 family protein [Segatella copri]|uniref:AIM24 family protein n=1 Tax=Segatella copri TaxID=165179 RepID=A0AA92UZC8_9BACT|nr:AIM24 family protein [Segatella copri]RHA83303.1 AIM24 family protein [Segatella copri]